LNDDFRRTGAGGKVVITEGVNMLGDELTEQAIQAVRAFDAFDADNDPYRKGQCDNITYGN
jgi:hypothetical protein